MPFRFRALIVSTVAAAFCAAAMPASAETDGRYSIAPAEGGGFVRLDRQTGQMSSCQRRGEEWSCRSMGEPAGVPGGEAAALREENQRLKAEIRQLEDILFSDKRWQERGPAVALPSEKDIDEAMSYAQRMLKRFRDKLKELEGGSSGTPL